MRWGPVRDRIVEGQQDGVRCWLDEVSKFLPEDEWEETLEGAKFRAELELERFYSSIKAKPELKTKV